MDLSDGELLKELQNIDEYEFEELVADLWEKFGWYTTVTSGSNDSGVDVIAEKNRPVYQKQLIQAKRYSSGNKVGSPDIQQYSSLRHQIDDVDTVVVITTSDFTTQAQETAGNLNVKTINGNDLLSIINTSGMDKEMGRYINTTQRYKKDVVEKLNECIRLSKKNSGNMKSIVFLNGSKSGYLIIPKHSTDFYNLHVFISSSNTIGKFSTRDFEIIKAVADSNNLQVVDRGADHGGKIYVGRKGGGIPEADEIKSVMSEFLSGVFSVSPQCVDVVNGEY